MAPAEPGDPRAQSPHGAHHVPTGGPGALATTATATAVEPLAGPVEGTLRVPGSKSLTARALVAAALAGGESTLTGALVSEDTERMVDCLRRLGVEVTVDGDGGVEGATGVTATSSTARSARPRSSGTRPSGARPSGATMVVRGAPGALARQPAELQVGLAGTVARFLTPLSATGDRPIVLDGTQRMRERPMADLVRSLRQLGARVEALGEADRLPIRVTGPLAGGEVAMAGDTSSQFLSGLLLAAPAMPRGLQVTLTTALVSRPYVDMTIATMAAFGVTVEEDTVPWPAAPAPAEDAGLEPASGGGPAGDPVPGARTRFTVRPAQRYRPAAFDIEPDASAASYVFAAAAITGSRLCVAGMHRRSVQGDIGFVDLLGAMGATVTDEPAGICVAGPSVGDGSSRLRGIGADMADCSDVAQSLAVVAPFASSATTITGIGFIRGKETDRIGATVAELRRCGIEADELPDGMTIRPSRAAGATIDPHGDHRMAMSFAVLGLAIPGIVIAEPQVVAKTFPAFFELIDQLHRLPARSDR